VSFFIALRLKYLPNPFDDVHLVWILHLFFFVVEYLFAVHFHKKDAGSAFDEFNILYIEFFLDPSL
jgi:hypothetical protein